MDEAPEAEKYRLPSGELSRGQRSMERARAQKANLAAAREDGALEVFEEFIPAVLETIKSRQALMPKIIGLVDEAIESRDTAALKDVAPLMKLMVDEDKRVLDRVLGSAVQRSKAEVHATVAHVSLKDLVNRSRVVDL